MSMMKYKVAALAVSCAVAFFSATGPVAAQTTTANFTAQIVIQDECVIQTTNTLDFGTHGVLDANVDASADIGVQCTNGAAYNIRLNGGATAGGTIATRLMANGGNTVAYQMYRDAGRSQNWGETDGTDTLASTGTGSVQTHTIFGRVAPQATPASATYTDTVTITVAY